MHAAVRIAPLRRATVPSSLGPVVVHYRDAGPGQAPGQATEVYLHGAAGSWTTFAPLLEQDPAGGRAAVLIDLPGWGETTAAPGWDRVDISTMADAVTEVLLGMGHQHWGLVGHSMGGFLALHLAATRPQHTMSVAVLSGTTFAAARAARHPVRGMLEFPAFTGMFLVMRSLAGMGRTGRWLVAAVGRTRGLDLLMAPFFADPSSVPQTVIRNLSADARPSSFSAAARAAAGYDFGLWRSIGCPVLATRGAGDVFTPARDLSMLAALVPQTRCVELADCGHFAPIEHSAQMARLLRGREAGAR